MLNKRAESRVVAPEQSKYIHEFISYLNREVFQQSHSSMLAGLLEVIFEDEEKPRHFTVYSRRSGALGDFLQIDQFSEHL